jgi:hypothetical protein
LFDLRFKITFLSVQCTASYLLESYFSTTSKKKTTKGKEKRQVNLIIRAKQITASLVPPHLNINRCLVYKKHVLTILDSNQTTTTTTKTRFSPRFLLFYVQGGKILIPSKMSFLQLLAR